MSKIGEIKNTRVLCRVDFNVPIKDGEIIDDNRIKAHIPTITTLLSNNNRVVLLTHLGYPKGKIVENLRLDIIAKRLGELLKLNVRKLNASYGPIIQKELEVADASDSVILLENVRFNNGEEINDPWLSKEYSKLADVFVLDCFSTLHRKHASVLGIRDYMKTYKGLLVEKEINNLEKIFTHRNSKVLILGGSKVSQKYKTLKELVPYFDYFVIGGVLANTFYKQMGFCIGNSIYCEEISADDIYKTIETIELSGKQLIIPDTVIVKHKDGYSKKSLLNIESNDYIVDVDRSFIERNASILHEADLIVFNGPFGYYEDEVSSRGTKHILEILKRLEATTIIGGGDTVSLINKSNSDSYSLISTGGGSLLHYLSSQGKGLNYTF
ncbi:phosphoglycerate kinase [Terribacillus saccharophilus]|uniref:phosphoglycerate kinase n=1 Tax=Terribacillus saccharophilus TaxID=361277 RepID=UPI00381DC65C